MILPACCARAASGHAAALPGSVMNSRRIMSDLGFLLPLWRQLVRSVRHAQPTMEPTIGP
jgi:hypothetical protein